MNSTLIREIQPEDNSAIAAVIRAVFITDDFPKTGTAFADKQLDSMFEAYHKPRAVYYVVVQNGKIVGGGGISQLDNTEDNICELQKMYFLSEVRGKGVGQQMIQRCLEAATAFGYDQCYLETLPEMEAAQHLYQKMGFRYICAPLGNTGHSTCPVWMIKDLR